MTDKQARVLAHYAQQLVATTIYAWPGGGTATRWFWQKGNQWIAVAENEDRGAWFADVYNAGIPMPMQTVYPIERRPTYGTLIYLDATGQVVTEPAVQ